MRGNHLGIGIGSTLIGGLAALLVAGVANVASADPMYVTGSECPSDAQMAAPGSELERQYYVTPSLRCVYDLDSITLQGTDEEADYYLNSQEASDAGWGEYPTGADDWHGLGQENGEDENIVGFVYSTDGGNDDGSFLISPLLGGYNQFAIAVKDGGDPFWAIFQLSVGQYTGDWGFSSTLGDLSHFALYGRFVSDDPDGPPTTVPEPASLLLLGSGIGALASRVRRKKSR